MTSAERGAGWGRRSPAGDESDLGPLGDTGGVGFNPHRQHRRSPLDYVLVAAALVICLGLVTWAVIG